MWTKQRRALLADDFTGALDTGVQFLGENRKPLLTIPDGGPRAASFQEDAGEPPELLVVDTESRFLEERAAAAAVSTATRELRTAGYSPFFKKIDSTFRGNVGAELDAMLKQLKAPAVAVVPAVPRNGRTLEDGVVYVHGVPLAQSESGRDPFTPNRSSSAREILAGQTGRSINEVSLEAVSRGPEELARRMERALSEGGEILIFDSRTEAHLRSIAEGVRLLGQPLLLAGASGFAAALVAAEAGPAAQDRERSVGEHLLRPGRGLIVAGSLMETTIVQAERLSSEAPSVATLQIDVREALTSPARERERLLASARRLLSKRSHLLLRTVADGESAGPVSKGEGLELAEFVGVLSREILREAALDTLILTGGSTALAVAHAVGIDRLRITGEVQSGVPLSEATSRILRREYRIVTKAGGFGGSDALLGMVAALDGRAAATG